MTAPAPLNLPAMLDDLERAHAAATPGPWMQLPWWPNSVQPKPYQDAARDGTPEGERPQFVHIEAGTPADAALIVAAVNAVPTLIAELRKRDAALQAVLDKCDRMEREAREDHTGDPNDAATVRANALHFAAHNLRATLTAALTPGADTAGATA